MRRRPVALLAAALLAGATPAAVAATGGPGPGITTTAGLTVVSDTVVAPTEGGVGDRLHRIVLETAALPGSQDRTEIQVLLPRDYAGAPTRRYPVLYALHGAGDTDRSWASPANGNIAALEDDTTVNGKPVGGLITVMPDGGNNPPRPRESGWYSDWVGSDTPGVGGPQWETYLIDQLLPWVDATYRTVPDRSHRIVAGLSMGGFGSMALAARHPDLFGVAGSFSGAVDIADGGPPEALAFNQLHSADGTPDDNVWGPYGTEEVHWRDHNPPDLAANLRNTMLFARNGTGVPGPGDNPADGFLEAGVAAMNATFRAALVANGIQCVCTVTPVGTHSWPYWRADMAMFLARLPEWIGNPAAVPVVPASFDYRSVAPAFSVYGWRVAADPRRAAEFLALGGVGPGGLTVTGSGLTTVRTPPRTFRPGQWVDVAGTGPHGTTRARAATDGSLTFLVDLGPAHTVQQDTTAGDLAGDRLATYFTTDTVAFRPQR